VTGDHLFVLDARGAKCLLYAATRMNPRAAVIAVANEQCRCLGYLVLQLVGSAAATGVR
jgi:hypothetical protein